MKLKELRPILRANRVNIYLEPKKPMFYEIWGLDDKTETLADYRLYDGDYDRTNDTMFLDYGEYTVEEIAEDKALNFKGEEMKAISIFISK
ncbi:hypothetical protein [Clostridium sp. HBUAS56017]|uniref:hypothetical protein n=1 Tax=Clostridium sp. HBUAS56017 TaxID=2571128 RepID=UPI001177ED73|nr:hypothetical protein [Clostridium sp. HBUAS56017]